MNNISTAPRCAWYCRLQTWTSFTDA